MRMAKNVTSCKGCPYEHYYSGGAYECTMVKQIIPERDKIASFCPLPIYPAQVMADMEGSLRLHQVQELKESKSLKLWLSRYVASLMKSTVGSHGSVEIKIKSLGEEKTIYFMPDYVKSIALYDNEITFSYKRETYRLISGTNGVTLYKAETVNGKELWSDQKL